MPAPRRPLQPPPSIGADAAAAPRPSTSLTGVSPTLPRPTVSASCQSGVQVSESNSDVDLKSLESLIAKFRAVAGRNDSKQGASRSQNPTNASGEEDKSSSTKRRRKQVSQICSENECTSAYSDASTATTEATTAVTENETATESESDDKRTRHRRKRHRRRRTQAQAIDDSDELRRRGADARNVERRRGHRRRRKRRQEPMSSDSLRQGVQDESDLESRSGQRRIRRRRRRSQASIDDLRHGTSETSKLDTRPEGNTLPTSPSQVETLPQMKLFMSSMPRGKLLRMHFAELAAICQAAARVQYYESMILADVTSAIKVHLRSLGGCSGNDIADVVTGLADIDSYDSGVFELAADALYRIDGSVEPARRRKLLQAYQKVGHRMDLPIFNVLEQRTRYEDAYMGVAASWHVSTIGMPHPHLRHF